MIEIIAECKENFINSVKKILDKQQNIFRRFYHYNS